MKEMLTTTLLIIVAVVIYMSIFGGPDGVEKQLRDSGQRSNQTIERINLYGEETLP